MLALLYRSTAAAFQCDMPRLRGLSREQCLQAYARFTAERAEDALRRGDGLLELDERLYRNAYRLGRLPGRLLRVQGVADAPDVGVTDARLARLMALAQFLYGILDIELEGRDSGRITVSRCYFSSFYSPQVCRLMSAMDRGLFAGLAGGGDLVFGERITEGSPCCRAHFSLPGRLPLAEF